MFASGFDHDHFGMMTAFHVLCLGNSLCSKSLWMMDYFVSNPFLVQIADQFVRYVHSLPPTVTTSHNANSRLNVVYRLPAKIRRCETEGTKIANTSTFQRTISEDSSRPS